jgi:hypothetical protein
MVLFGLILMTHGARLAALVTGLLSGGLAGIGGVFLSHSFGLPLWPTVAVCGLGGCVFSMLTFRMLLATSMAAGIAVAGLSAYSVSTLLPHLNTYTSAGLESGLVSLPDAAVQAQGTSPTAELGAIWAHLSGKVPNMQTTLLTILAVGSVVGLVIGWALPWAARSLWGATIGTVLFAVGGIALLEQFTPQVNDWLQSIGPWGWSILVSLWLTSLLYNLLSAKQRKPQPSQELMEPQPAAA